MELIFSVVLDIPTIVVKREDGRNKSHDMGGWKYTKRSLLEMWAEGASSSWRSYGLNPLNRIWGLVLAWTGGELERETEVSTVPCGQPSYIQYNWKAWHPQIGQVFLS